MALIKLNQIKNGTQLKSDVENLKNTLLQTLQRSAKYEAGELASESSLPFGLVLYCSTAGTTSANAVTI